MKFKETTYAKNKIEVCLLLKVWKETSGYTLVRIFQGNLKLTMWSVCKYLFIEDIKTKWKRDEQEFNKESTGSHC